VRLAALALISLAGCDLVFKVNVPDVCSNGSFVSQAVVDGMPQEHLFDPTLRDDGLELFFTRSIAGAEFDIFVATRATTDEPFGPASPLAFDSLQGETDAQLTADGLNLFFLTNNALFLATRTSRAVPFTTAKARPDVDPGAGGINGYDISADGLTIYLSEGDALLVAHRQSVVSPFGATSVIGPHMDFPSISHDELELFFQNIDDGTIRRVRRDSRDALFDGPAEVVFPGEDPEITDDGLQLVFGPPTGMGLAIAQRNCDE
jgi:hypothetical protein